MRIRSPKDVWYFVAVVTLLSVSMAETSVFLLYVAKGREAFHFEAAVLFAGVVPVLISVPISLFVARMSLVISLTQIELQHLADTDPLTALPNRRSFFSAAEAVLDNGYDATEVHALLVIDADHFKELNDSYGHSAGDIALVAIADILRSSFRETDLICRVGGEEFAVLLKNTSAQQAERLAQRVVDAVAQTPISTDGAIIEYSVSCGVADTSLSYDLKTLFKAADDAMYMAKRQGRNRVALIDAAA